MIYADNAATTRVSNHVAEVVDNRMMYWYGNPSSQHDAGRVAKSAIRKTEEIIRNFFNADRYGVVFTSGATESDNMAINFAISAGNASCKRNIVISAFEHPAIYEACKNAEKHGFTVTQVYPNRNGIINPEDVENTIQDDTILVSIMAVNNELGTEQPIEQIGDICQRRKVYFHTDATQAIMKSGFDVRLKHVDMLSCTAHKIYGPKGIGLFLYNGSIDNMAPMLYGGHQQNGIRPGTENVPGIAGFGAALEDIKNGVDAENALNAKKEFVKKLSTWDHQYSFNANSDRTESGIVSLRVNGFKGQNLVLLLSALKGVYVSSGSACSSGSKEASRVLRAIGLSSQEASETIRVSFGRYNAPYDGVLVAKSIIEIVEDMSC